MKNVFDPHVLNCRIMGSISRKMYSFISRKFLGGNISPVSKRLLALMIIHYHPKNLFSQVNGAVMSSRFQGEFMARFLPRMQKLLKVYNIGFSGPGRKLVLPNLYKTYALFKKMYVTPRPAISEIKTASSELTFFSSFTHSAPENRSDFSSVSQKIDRKLYSNHDLNSERVLDVKSVFEKYMHELSRKIESADDPISNIQGYGVLDKYTALWFEMEGMFANPLFDTIKSRTFSSSVREDELLAEDPTVAIIFRYMLEAVEYVLWDNPEGNLWDSMELFVSPRQYLVGTNYENSEFVDMLRPLFNPSFFQERVRNIMFLDVEFESGRHMFVESPYSPFKFVDSSIPDAKRITVSEKALSVIPVDFRKELEDNEVVCSYGNPSVSGESLMLEMRYKINDPYGFLKTVGRLFLYSPKLNLVSFSNFVKDESQLEYSRNGLFIR